MKYFWKNGYAHAMGEGLRISPEAARSCCGLHPSPLGSPPCPPCRSPLPARAVFIYTGGASSGGGRFGRAGLALGGCASGFVAGTAFARSGRGPSHGRPFPAPRPLFFAAPPRSRAPLARLGWKRPRGCSRGAYSPRPQGRPLYTPHGRQPACSLPSARGSVCRSPAGRHSCSRQSAWPRSFLYSVVRLQPMALAQSLRDFPRMRIIVIRLG